MTDATSAIARYERSWEIDVDPTLAIHRWETRAAGWTLWRELLLLAVVSIVVGFAVALCLHVAVGPCTPRCSPSVDASGRGTSFR